MKRSTLLILLFVFLMSFSVACQPNAVEESVVESEEVQTFEELTSDSENVQTYHVSTMMLANEHLSAVREAAKFNECVIPDNYNQVVKVSETVFLYQEYRHPLVKIDNYVMQLSVVASSPQTVDILNVNAFVSPQVARAYLRAHLDVNGYVPLRYAVVEVPGESDLDLTQMTNPVTVWCGDKHQAPGR